MVKASIRTSPRCASARSGRSRRNQRTIKGAALARLRPGTLKTQAVALARPAQPPAAGLAYSQFPGRTVLYVSEVAKGLEITKQHVCNLIEEGVLHAINVAGGKGSRRRKSWRIPIDAYQAFLKKRSSLGQAA